MNFPPKSQTVTYIVSASLLLLALFPARLAASALTLAWDPNTENDLAGYNVYYGIASSDYGFVINVGNVTDYTVTDLEPETQYYFAITAYDTSWNESDFSVEVSAATDSKNTVVSDFDADGVPDILWRDGASGSNAIWYMEGDGTSTKGVTGVPGCGTSWHVGKIADFDADGVPDIFWRDGTSGSNAIWYMEANGTSIKGVTGVPGCGANWDLGG